MSLPLADLLASRDWYPHITLEGDVSDAIRFVDLDAGVPNELAALASRVCVLIGVTSGGRPDALRDAAGHLDLVLSSAPDDNRHVITVPDIDEAMGQLRESVSQCPRSAMVLSALLRQSVGLSTGDGIAAEASAYSTLLAGPEFANWLGGRSARKRPPLTESARVVTTLDDGALHIRMTRKLRLNAIDAAMRQALVEAFAIAIADRELTVELTGEGPCFSNGGDLREFGTTPDPATAWAVRLTEHPGWQLAQIADRTHVRMHGRCIGAGVEMAAFAGHISADPQTTFLLPELSMGLLPGAGGCVSIPRRIGRWRTLWMVLSATALSASQALDWGLIDDIRAID